MPVFQSMGIHNPVRQRLGKGAFGTAYEVDLRGKSVLKLTRDPTEVQAACLLIGKETERIVRVHAVWAIKGTFKNDLRGWYAIHRDYLTPLSKRDTRLVDAIFEVYDDETLDLTIPRKRNHVMLDKWRGYLREELQSPDGGIPVDEDGIRVASFGGKQALQRAMSLLLTIGKAVDEMHRMGVDWEDIHSGNIMRDHRGKLVIADIGWGLVHEEFEQKVSFLSVERAEQYKAPVPAAEAAEA
jgi:serine/threonine protein kinase